MQTRTHLPPYGPPGGYRTFDTSQSDFVSLRADGKYYVDRTLFVQHVLEASSSSMLIPRPRRFGKTLNMTMLRDFLSIPSDAAYGEQVKRAFEQTAILEDANAMQHFQQHPVLYFTFKDCKARTWEEMSARINAQIGEGLSAHEGLLGSQALSEKQKKQVKRISSLRASLAQRSEALVAAWRRRAIGAGLAAGALAVLGLAAMAAGESSLWPGFRDRAWPLVLLSAAGAATSFLALWRRRFTIAAGAAAVAVGAVTAGWAVAQHPHLLLPAAPAAAAEPAAWSTAAHAPDRVLRALLGTTAAGAVLLVPSLAFLFRVFKSMPKSEPSPARE